MYWTGSPCLGILLVEIKKFGEMVSHSHAKPRSKKNLQAGVSFPVLLAYYHYRKTGELGGVSSGPDGRDGMRAESRDKQNYWVSDLVSPPAYVIGLTKMWSGLAYGVNRVFVIKNGIKRSTYAQGVTLDGSTRLI